ncbi:hypothetical protein SNOG_10550 [Parastagonospora nodorum SN15]|uniref:Phosphomannose isomerase type I catalytic domain-containing protein n=1 Tax=Phaeosphaeria nodorum (strain SN15 / ATCC MYA-4574 / FGSC 10173) TaxID=321614 RepID=Q0UCG4_PHANO|nr:hypothetical protein SNOG_10550 [Parastagonospora nodorum SN15]EAT81944.2 hypothetical protein SNOG_10550 [Parastagonospora nodorum SN15]
MRNPLIRLECGVNSYDWGKVGKTSAAAKFHAATASDFSIEEEKPYAELWMGTHPSLPSKDLETKRSLLDLVQENQALLSPEIAQKYENRLPFLFKVLSINKALSIQAHPNKKLAEQLHAKDPKNYPDDNPQARDDHRGHSLRWPLRLPSPRRDRTLPSRPSPPSAPSSAKKKPPTSKTPSRARKPQTRRRMSRPTRKPSSPPSQRS